MRTIIILLAILGAVLVAGCASTTTEGRAVGTQAVPLQAPDPMEAGFQRLADQIVAGLRTQQATQIAVVQFENLDGSVSEFGGFITEEMTTRLYQAGTFRVVEREMLNRVMAEHELATSGLLDESTAKELGKLLGVDAIAAGTVTDLGAEVRVNSRLIATETGSVFSAAAVTLPKDERIANLMGHYLVSTAAGSAGAARAAEGAKPAAMEHGAAPGEPGLAGEYYNLPANTTDLAAAKPVYQRVDATIKCNYASSPVPRVTPDWFGIRWTGYVHVSVAGTYTLSFTHDDILKVWIDGRKVYDRGAFTGGHWIPVDVDFDKAGWLPFRAEFVEFGSGAYCGFRWALPGEADFVDVGAESFRHD